MSTLQALLNRPVLGLSFYAAQRTSLALGAGPTEQRMLRDKALAEEKMSAYDAAPKKARDYAKHPDGTLQARRRVHGRT